MIPLALIRPEPGCAQSVAAAAALGLDARGFALFEVSAAAWDAPDPVGFDALLAGSANAFRHAGPALERYRALPVHVVGEKTAAAAREAGFTVGMTGAGGLQAVLERIAPGTRLLRLAGAERLALAPPAGVTMAERTVYASHALPLPGPLADLLRAGAVVAVHSGEAARHLAAECDRLGLDRAGTALVCIGPRVAAMAGSGWRAVEIAASPDETALLAKAAQLCQTDPGRQAGPMAEEQQIENEAPSPAIPASPAATAPSPEPVAAAPQPAPRAGRTGLVLTAALIAFALGGGLVGYAAWTGFPPFAPPPAAAPPARTETLGTIASSPVPAESLASRQDTLEGRIGAMEQRLDAIVARADAASGNAARAEALLVALASRRALDRGAPLGYLEDQLRLRFGDSQPNAVATVIAAAREPVTLDELIAGLDSRAAELTRAPESASAWQRVKRELSGLFVIRHGSAPSPLPKTMLGRARVLLEAGRIDDAAAQVRLLPGAADAGDWLTAARRYDDARRALDVLETSALLDARRGEAAAMVMPGAADNPAGAGQPRPVPVPVPAPPSA